MKMMNQLLNLAKGSKMFPLKLPINPIIMTKGLKSCRGVINLKDFFRCRACSTIQQKVIDVEKHGASINRKSTEAFRQAMSKVPHPVVVVTSATFNNQTGKWFKRGVTCSSLTSVSLEPPVVSFTMAKPSRMHDLLLKSHQFVIHVLGEDQVKYGVHFSRLAVEGKDQFSKIPHEINDMGLPVILGTPAVLDCKAHSVHTVGDHHVWYGEVVASTTNPGMQNPLLYFSRSYRSVGDELFIKAFEDTTLAFEEWDHQAHLQMAWNYIKEYGKEEATPMIKNGIQQYNLKNKDKITAGYHETVTQFFIHVINVAIQKNPQSWVTFEDFMESNSHLEDKHYLLKFYSKQIISSEEARTKFILPDLRPLPE